MGNDALARLRVVLEADTSRYKTALMQASNVSKQVTSMIEAEMKGLQDPFGRAREAIDRLQVSIGRKVETKAFKDVKQQIIETQAAMSNLLAKMEEMRQKGTATEQTAEFQKLSAQLTDAESTLAGLEAKQRELEASGQDYVLTEYYTNLLEKIRATEKEIDELTRKLEEAKERLASAQATGGNTIEPSNAISRYESELRRMQRILDIYHEAQQNARDKDMTLEATPEMSKLIEQLEQATAKVSELREQMEQLKQEGGDVQESSAFASMQDEFVSLSSRMGELTQRRMELASSGQAVEAATRRETTAFRALKALLSGLSAVLTSLSQGFSAVVGGIRKASGAFASLINRFASGIPKSASRATSAVSAFVSRIASGIPLLKRFSRETNSGTNSMDQMKSSIKTILRYAFGIRSMFMLVNRLRRAFVSAVKEGLDNLAQYDKLGQVNQSLTTLHSSLIQLKNAMGAAFAPILVAITPALNKLIQMATKAADAVGQLMSALTGVPYVKAKAVTEDYAESLENQKKKAKETKEETEELERELMGFDRINKLSDKDEDKDKDDDDDDTGLKPSDMFEPGTIASKWSELADKIKSIIDGLMKVVKAAWNQEGEKVLAAARRALENIKKLIGDIASTFYKVFTEGYGFDWLVSVFNKLRAILRLIGSIAEAFDKAWNDDNAGYDYVASIFEKMTAINNLIADIADAFARAWESEAGVRAAKAILRYLTTINRTIAKMANAFRQAWNKDDIGFEIFETLLDSLAEVLDLISDITRDFGLAFESQSGLDMLDAFLHAIKSILEMVGNVAAAFRTAWNDNGLGLSILQGFFNMLASILWLISDIARDFGQAFNSPVGIEMIKSFLRMLGEIFGMIKNIAEAFRTAWNDNGLGMLILQKFFAMLDSIFKLIGDIARDFGQAFNSPVGIGMLQNFLRMVGYLFDAVRAVADAFRDVWNDGGFGMSVLLSIFSMWSAIFGLLGDVMRDFARVFSDGAGREMIRSILELFKTIHEIIGTITVAFRSAWNDDERGYKYINSIAKTISAIFLLLNGIGQAFITAWEEGGRGEAIMQNVLDIVTGISNTIGGFAESIRRGWEENGNGVKIWAAILVIVDTILSKVDGIVQSTKEWAKDLDFSPIFEAFGTLLEKINPVVDAIGEGLEWGWKNVLLPLGKWTIEEALPAALEALGSALELIGSVLDTLGPALTPLWDNIIKPLAEKTGAALVLILGWISDALTTLSDWIRDHSEGFSTFVEVVGTFVATWLIGSGIASIIGGITTALGGIITAITGAGGIVPAITILLGSFNPILLGLGALAAGVVLLVSHWDGLKEAVHRCFEVMDEDVEQQLENIPALMDALRGLNTVVDILEDTSGLTAEQIEILNQSLSDSSIMNESASEAVSHFKEACEKAGVAPETLAEACKNAGVDMDAMALTADNAGDAMVQAFQQHNAQVTESLEDVQETLDDTKEAVEDVKSTTSTATSDMDGAMSSFSQAVEQWMSNANTAISGTGSAMNNLSADTQTASSEASDAVSGLKSDIETALGEMNSSFGTAQGTVTDWKTTTGTDTQEMSEFFANFQREVDAKVEAVKTAINGGSDSVTAFDKATEAMSNNMSGYFEKINSDITSNMTDAAGTVNDKSGSMNTDVTSANTEINKDTARQWDEIRLSVDTAFASIYSGSMEWVKKLRDDLYDRFEAIAVTLPKKFKGIDGDIAEHFNSVGSSVEAAVNPDGIISMFQGISDSAVSAFNETASDIARQFSGLPDGIYNNIDPNALSRMAEEASRNLTTPFESARDQIEGAFRGMSFFDTFELYDLGQRAGEQLAAGFKNTYIQTPHMYISGWDQHSTGNGGMIVTPQFSVQWYAKGGFPKNGEMFVANENGIEAMGKMGNRNVVANNEQIVDGIRRGVLDAMLTAGSQGGQPIQIDLYIDGKKMSREVIKEINRTSKATGRPVFDS